MTKALPESMDKPWVKQLFFNSLKNTFMKKLTCFISRKKTTGVSKLRSENYHYIHELRYLFAGYFKISLRGESRHYHVRYFRLLPLSNPKNYLLKYILSGFCIFCIAISIAFQRVYHAELRSIITNGSCRTPFFWDLHLCYLRHDLIMGPLDLKLWHSHSSSPSTMAAFESSSLVNSLSHFSIVPVVWSTLSTRFWILSNAGSAII